MRGLSSLLPHSGGLTEAEVADTVADSGGSGMNEEIDKLPVRGRVLGDAGDAMGEAETGQIVVETAMVEVMVIVEST
jgi:hypothetical protein